MADPAKVLDQNLLPVQAYFAVDGTFQTFIGQGQPFYATVNPYQSGLFITNSTIDSTTIGATTPSTGVFTNILSTTGQITTTPSANTDIANKFYVDTVAQGLGPKAACAVATTVNITLSGLQTIDGYTTLAGDRVLVKNQGTSSQNGIYIASASAWTRSTDMDVWSEVPGAYTVILNGGQANTGWVCTATSSGTIGVTAMPWVQFSAAGTYFAGTGLTLASNTFSITNTGVIAASVGSASKTLTATVNAQGQLTALADTNIAINGNQITSGTIGSSYLTGSYTGITGVGTLTAGTWNASTIGVAYGGTGAITLTGYVYGNGTGAMSAATTIPTTVLSGTITNAQLANSTISGVSLGSNLFSLTIGSGLSGTSYNGSAAVTITNSSPMVYPAAGIPSSTGTAWNTSYSTTGSGTVLALATAPTLNNPTISNYESYTPSAAPTYTEGRVWYDSTAYALSYYNNTTNNVVHIGQEIQQQVRNSTAATITKGSVVYISGSTGQIGNIILAQANAYISSQVIGVANQDIPINTNGWIVTQGTVSNIDTSAFTAGNPIYLSATTAGELTQTEPSTPNYAVHMGVCLYSNVSNGKIYINPINKSIDTGYIIGQVAIAQGGTNGTAIPTAGAVPYGTGTAYAFTGAGTTGQVLTSNGSSAPTWSSPTASIAITDDTSTITARYLLFTSATTGSISTEYVSSTKLQYVPSTGVLSATGFSGSGASLTSLTAGNLSGTIPSAVLGNSTVYIGTTAVLLNRTSGSISLTGTNIDGSAGSATTATTATNATNIAITDNTSSSSTYYPAMSVASSGNNPATTSSTKLSFVPSTGTLSATKFAGALNGSVGATTPSTGVFTNVNTPNTFAFKNRLINGLMMVDQRNAGAAQTFTAGAALAYSVDRWYGYCTGANVTGQQIAGNTSPSVTQNRYRFTGAASVTAVGFGQRIEQKNCYDLAGSTCTLSADLAISATLTSVTWTAYYATTTADTFGTLASPTVTQIATGTFTVSSTVTNFSTNISVPAAATTGIQIVFTVGALTAGLTWTIGNVQFEKGAVATSFDYRPYGLELDLCRRYFWNYTGFANGAWANGQSNGATNARLFLKHPVPMRANPTLSFTGTPYVTNAAASGINISAFSTNYGGSVSLMFDATVSAGLVAGNATIAGLTNSTDVVSITAEL